MADDKQINLFDVQDEQDLPGKPAGSQRHFIILFPGR